MLSGLATPPRLLGDPVIARTASLASQLLAPHADHVAEHGVPRSHLDALADAGTLGLAAYEPIAPLGAEEVRRESTELLAAADGATWFVSAQHHLPVREVLTSTNQELRERWLEDLRSGRTISAIATSHLRQPKAQVIATRQHDGWRISGQLHWVTGWSLTDVIMIGATTADDTIVFVLVPWHPPDYPGPVTPHSLWSMSATNTVTLDVHEILAPENMVVKVVTRHAWLEWDSCYHANVNPAVFGLIRAASNFLASETGDDQQFAELGTELSLQGAQLRGRAYALRDQVPLNERIDEKRMLRGAAVDLACRSVTACVVAAGARGMRRGSTINRLVAETFFHAVQGQDQATRNATARHLLAALAADRDHRLEYSPKKCRPVSLFRSMWRSSAPE